MNGPAALALIKSIGIFGLDGPDGCLCLHWQTHGVEVDVSCRKSSDPMDRIVPWFYGVSLRVHSRHMDASGTELRAIADEVAKQLAPEGYAIAARFCDYDCDKHVKCTYCGKPRQELSGYLCTACLGKTIVGTNVAVAEEHDFTKYDFLLPAAPE